MRIVTTYCANCTRFLFTLHFCFLLRCLARKFKVVRNKIPYILNDFYAAKFEVAYAIKKIQMSLGFDLSYTYILKSTLLE